MKHFERGLWSESFAVYRRNTGAIVVYLIGMLIILAIGEHLSRTTGIAAGASLIAGYLAMPAHLTVLTGENGADQMKNPEIAKRFQKFLMRVVGLGLLPLVPLAASLFVLSASTSLSNKLVIFLSMLFALTCVPAIFAKWGTMLPAAAVGVDPGFFRAGERGRVIFFYALSRLLISMGLLTVLILGLEYFFAQYVSGHDKLISAQGMPNLGMIITTATTLLGYAFQIVMTAVILSRSYLIAEQKTAALPVT
jgi:hypothetical protein